MKNKMTSIALMAQRLNNPFADGEGFEQKPGPVLSNGKRIKIKDMTKKKKSRKDKNKADTKNSGMRSKNSQQKKSKNKSKKQLESHATKQLQDEINYVFADNKKNV